MSLCYINTTFWKWKVLVGHTRWTKPMLIYPFSSRNTKQATERTEKILNSEQEIKYNIKYRHLTFMYITCTNINYILLKYVFKFLYILRIFQGMKSFYHEIIVIK